MTEPTLNVQVTATGAEVTSAHGLAWHTAWAQLEAIRADCRALVSGTLIPIPRRTCFDRFAAPLAWRQAWQSAVT